MPEPSVDGPPPAGVDLRQARLARAAAVRDRRDSVVASLTDGRLRLVDLLASGRRRGDLGHIKIVTAVQAVPGVGKVGARRVLADLGIGPTRMVADLSDSETSALLVALDG